MAIEIPDEYGLSSDSMRGSHQFIQPHQVGADGPLARLPLSANEIRALEDKGILVDADGYEREPEPVIPPPPPMVVRMRTRPDEAPGKTVFDPATANDPNRAYLPSEDRGYIPPTQGAARPSTPRFPSESERESAPVTPPAPYGTPPFEDTLAADRARADAQIAADRAKAEAQIVPQSDEQPVYPQDAK